LEEDNRKLAEGVEALRGERDEFNENLKDLMEKLFEVETNLEKANTREDRILEQKAKLIMDLKDREKDVQQMKQKLHENDNKMKNVMEDLNNYIDNLKTEKDKLEDENERLRSELKDKEFDVEEMERELMENGNNPRTLKRMDTVFEIDMKLKKQQGKLDKERSQQLQKMVENLERELEKLRRDDEKNKQKIGDLKEEIKEMDRQIKQEQRNNDNLNNEIEMLNEDLRYQEEMREEEKERVKNSGMNVSIIQGRKEIKDMGGQVKKLNEENRKLLDDLERVRAEREVWKDRAAEKEDELVLKEKEIDILKRNQNQDKEELLKVKDLLEGKNKELARRRQNEESLRLEGVTLGEEKLKLKGEKVLAEKERDYAVKALENNKTYMQEDMEKKKKEINRLVGKVKAVENENDQLEIQVYDLKKNLELLSNAKDKMKMNSEVKDSKIEDLKGQIEYLKKQLAAAESRESMNKMDVE
jgi:chromosome segregation ATPase